MPSKGRSKPPRSAEEQERHRRRLRAAEDMLLREYDAAQRELDQMTSSGEPDKGVVERYVQTLQRLRKLLAEEIIPPDIEQKLPQD